MFEGGVVALGIPGWKPRDSHPGFLATRTPFKHPIPGELASLCGHVIRSPDGPRFTVHFNPLPDTESP